MRKDETEYKAMWLVWKRKDLRLRELENLKTKQIYGVYSTT